MNADDSPLRHTLLRALFRSRSLEQQKRRLVLVMAASVDFEMYADDSGGSGQPFLVLAGLLATSKQWDDLRSDWQRVLDEPPKIPYSHMCKAWDFADEEGPFCGLSAPERSRKLIALSEIVQRHTVRGVANYLDLTTFARNLERRGIRHVDPSMDKEYHHCFRGVAILVSLVATKLGWVDKVHLFMEKQATTEPERPAQRSIEWTKQGSNSPVRCYSPLPAEAWAMADLAAPHLGSVSFIPGKADSPPLQAADMFAWHVNRRLIGKGKQPEAWGNLAKIKSYLTETDTEHAPTPRVIPWSDFVAEPPVLNRNQPLPPNEALEKYMRRVSELAHRDQPTKQGRSRE